MNTSHPDSHNTARYSVAEKLVPEFDHETTVTRSLLALLPQAQLSWKPHPRSFSLGELACHIATIPLWAEATLRALEFDVAPPGQEPWKPPVAYTVTEIMALFERGSEQAKNLLAATVDSEMLVPWSLKKGGAALFTMPRIAVFRAFIIKHAVHHRGQLSVYLRMCEVALPPIYGPTADAPF